MVYCSKNIVVNVLVCILLCDTFLGALPLGVESGGTTLLHRETTPKGVPYRDEEGDAFYPIHTMLMASNSNVIHQHIALLLTPLHLNRFTIFFFFGIKYTHIYPHSSHCKH